MARKMLYREVTTTTVKCATLSLVEGQAVISNLEDEVMIGNVSQEFAQRQLNKKYGVPVTIIEIFPETHQYEMPIDEFIKLASVKQKQMSIDDVE